MSLELTELLGEFLCELLGSDARRLLPQYCNGLKTQRYIVTNKVNKLQIKIFYKAKNSLKHIEVFQIN